MTKKKYYTRIEAANYFGVSLAAIDTWMQPSHFKKYGFMLTTSGTLLSQEDIDKFIAKKIESFKLPKARETFISRIKDYNKGE